MKKHFLVVGIMFLFVFSSVPVTFGYKVKTSNEEPIVKSVNFNSYYISNTDIIKSNQIDTQKETLKPLAGPMDSPWPMLSYDQYHTGRSNLSTAKNPGAEIWRVKTRYNSGMFQTTPVIDNNGTIYIGLKSNDHISYLITYNPNGTEKWRFLSENWIWSTPAIADDGTIYFTSAGDYFYAINPNGTLKWRYDHDWSCHYSSPTIGPDGIIYFGNRQGMVYALRPDGTKKWHHMLGGTIKSTPVIGPDGTIYIGCGDFYLYALNPDDGEMIWHYRTGYSIYASPSLASDGTIYVPSRDGYLYALYSSNGTFKWKATTGPKVVGAGCAIANDGTIYVGTEKLRAYNPNGTLKWESDVKGWVYGTVPAISADGTIFVSGGGCLVAVNPDGTIKWYKQLTKVQIETSPSIGPDDRVYTACTISGANYLSAFGIGPVRADAQGPYYGFATFPVQFQGLDFGGVPPYSYLWDFGDGHTSTLINPVHNYSQVGNYTAAFTITDSQGNSSTNVTYVSIIENQAPTKPSIDGPVNGNVGRISALNNFTGKFLGREDLLVQAPESEYVNKQVLSRDALERYVTAAETPLEKLVVSLQVDGLLRPAEICELKLDNIDFENRKLYLDDTKSGNNYIIMSRLLADRIIGYKQHRVQPKRKEDKNNLVIIDKGNRKGLPPTSTRPDFIYNLTKKLAVRAKIERKVYPYLIKPSVITNYFNKNVNPKTIRRMARHKYIETTLRYDHTDDMTVKDFFDRKDDKPRSVPTQNNEKTELKETAEMLQRLVNGEINLDELAKELGSLKHKEHKDDMAYA